MELKIRVTFRERGDGSILGSLSETNLSKIQTMIEAGLRMNPLLSAHLDEVLVTQVSAEVDGKNVQVDR